MPRSGSKWLGPMAAGIAWSACALACTWLLGQGAVLLVWLPSGIAVACHFATPIKQWPRMMAVLAVFQFATLWLTTGTPAGAIGYTLDSQVEAALCGYFGIRVLGGRKRSPRDMRHIVGMLAGAMGGSAAGALVALPFMPVTSVHELAWRFLATVLGVLAGAPACLRLRQWLGFGDQAVRIWAYEPKPYLGVTIAAVIALAAIVLSAPVSGLMPVLFVAVVFAVIRFGQMAAACGVLAIAAAATLVSLGGASPVAAWRSEPFMAGLALQAQMLLMLASTLPIAAMLLARDRLQVQLHGQNQELSRNLTILQLAKSLAGIGRWQYDLRSGVQNWSPAMLELNGLTADLAPDPGNVRALLPDGGDELFGHIAANRDAREPYTFEYRVSPPDSPPRILKMRVSNEFDETGERVALFAVAMDVTDQVERELALRTAREQAISLAAESQKLANTDALTGLSNRRATFDWLTRLIKAADESGEPLSVVMFDIDHFKQINDCFGHLVGDDVLRKVARIARSVMRGQDLVGRIGGEEFVCLLPSVEPQVARNLAERLRRAVADKGDDDGLPVATISLGLAVLRAGDTPESLLGRADGALYEAKDAGRNQVRRAA